MSIAEQIMRAHADAVRLAYPAFGGKDENLKADFQHLFDTLKRAVVVAVAIEKAVGVNPGVERLVGPHAFDLDVRKLKEVYP
jgi:hypothetical protein